MSKIERADILRAAETLGKLQPAPAATERAVRRVREALTTGQWPNRSHRIRGIIVKLAVSSGVAAAILIAVGLLLTIQTTQPASAAEQLKEVAKINDAYKGWIHITLTSVKSNPTTQGIPKSGAIHANTADNTIIQVLETNDGTRDVIYASASLGEIWRYNSRTNKIEIELLGTYSAQQMSTTLLDQATAKGFLDRLSIREGGKKKLNVEKSRKGRFDRFDIAPVGPGSFQKATLLVDPESKLIRKLTVVGEMGVDQLVAVYEYTYGEPAIKDIYGLGVPRDAVVIDNRRAASQPTRPSKATAIKAVPRDAKVVDERPAEQTKALLERLEGRTKRAFGDCVAVMTICDVQLDGKPDPRGGSVRVFAANDKKRLAFDYRAGTVTGAQAPSALFALPAVPAGWPRPKVSELIKELRAISPNHYCLVDDKDGWIGWYDGKSPSHYRSRLLGPEEKTALLWLAGEIWPSPQLRMRQYGQSAKVEMLGDRKHPEQIGVRIDGRNQDAPDIKQRQETIIWLDRARDDMPVERIYRTYGKDNKTVGREDITHYGSHAQLSNGQWYPTRWRTTSDLHSDMGRGRMGNRGRIRATREYHLQIVPNMKLDDEWFTNPAGKFKTKKAE